MAGEKEHAHTIKLINIAVSFDCLENERELTLVYGVLGIFANALNFAVIIQVISVGSGESSIYVYPRLESEVADKWNKFPIRAKILASLHRDLHRLYVRTMKRILIAFRYAEVILHTAIAAHTYECETNFSCLSQSVAPFFCPPLSAFHFPFPDEAHQAECLSMVMLQVTQKILPFVSEMPINHCLVAHVIVIVVRVCVPITVRYLGRNFFAGRSVGCNACISKARAHEWHIVWSLAETTGTHRTTHCTVMDMDNCNVCKP